MATSKCDGCLGSGRCWVCLASGFADIERRVGQCSRCHGTRRCHLCAETTPAPDPTDGRRVLVVDDEPQIRTLIGMWLEDDPRCETVATAADGDAALLALAQADPDVIVVDHNLGSHTSDEYLPGFRSAAPAARIIVHTGNPQAAEAARVRDRGADDVLEKGRASLDDVAEAALGTPPDAGKTGVSG